MKQRNAVFIGLIMIMVLTAACSAPAPAADRETLYQVSSFQALSDGEYSGIVSTGSMKEEGDFGLGTFAGLDGEMVVLDGSVYRVDVSGEVAAVGDDAGVPFANVTFFDVDTEGDLSSLPDLASLAAALEGMMPDVGAFYAIRIEGVFETLTLRSVPGQEPPYPVLANVIAQQAVFEYSNVTGTLVGIWMPGMVGELGVPGMHMHFLSDDRAIGGHVLDCSLVKGRAALDETPVFEVYLGED